MIKIPYYENSNFALHNFSAHAITYKGDVYPTAEHAFHASKFDDEKIKDEIKNAESPVAAFALGKKYKPLRKKNWDEIKAAVLYEILTEKATQHEDVRLALLATGNEDIVEDNPNDAFWGNGKDGNGRNETGKILMRIREGLRS